MILLHGQHRQQPAVTFLFSLAGLCSRIVLLLLRLARRCQRLQLPLTEVRLLRLRNGNQPRFVLLQFYEMVYK